MSLPTPKQTKPIFLFALAIALLGGVSYGGYRYWESKQPITESQRSTIGGSNAEEKENNFLVFDTCNSQTMRIDTTGWKEYKLDKYGLSFRYPPGWQSTGGPHETDVVFWEWLNILPVSVEAPNLTITIHKNVDGLSLDEWFDQRHPREFLSLCQSSITITSVEKTDDERWKCGIKLNKKVPDTIERDIISAGKNAIRRYSSLDQCATHSYVLTVFMYKDWVYEIGLTNFNKYEGLKDLYDGVLTTFSWH